MKTKTFLTFTLISGLCSSALAQSFEPVTNRVGQSFSALAQTLTQVITNYAVNLPIPDNNASGIISTKDFVAPSIDRIGDVNVTLKISGNFNGDLFGFLTHNSGYSVLLNRVGRIAGNDLGYGDGGVWTSSSMIPPPMAISIRIASSCREATVPRSAER